MIWLSFNIFYGKIQRTINIVRILYKIKVVQNQAKKIICVLYGFPVRFSRAYSKVNNFVQSGGWHYAVATTHVNTSIFFIIRLR